MALNTTTSNSFSPVGWDDVNWNALRRLRARFLEFDPRGGEGAADRADYWRQHSELASYDFTFAERIGWKWDTLLAELQARGWTPPGGTLWDWGCGTGVAGRRVLEAWPDAFGRLLLSDRSGPAVHFAASRARALTPALEVRAAAPADTPNVLVLSHVLNELTPPALEALLALAAKAQTVLWVEPGTHPVSRQLIAVRERLLPRFRAVFPCTHQAPCGMLAEANARHWCHHFARVPAYVHTDPGWGKFAQNLEIDLSTIPFSALVLDRRPAAATGDPALGRVIGEPRFYKGFAKLLCCQADGVAERTLQKRDAGPLFKTLKKEPGSLFRWERDGEKLRGMDRIF